MTTMLDEFDLDVRLGEPVRTGASTVGLLPTNQPTCPNSGWLTCGATCPTKPQRCPTGPPDCI